MWKYITIAIFILCIIYLSVIQWGTSSIDYLTPTLTHHQLIATVDNGDLIFLSGSTFSEKTIKFWTRSHFSHVGIIVREIDAESGESVPYILEADYGGGHKDGVRLMKLEDKLSRYRGSSIGGWRRRVGYRPKTDKMLKFVGELLDRNFEMDPNMLCWLFSNAPDGPLYRVVRSPNDRVIFCSEMVIAYMRKLGMATLPTDTRNGDTRHPTWYSPQTLAAETFPGYDEMRYFSLR